ncbi:CRTAC1 family protein [Adhaeribacter rhizoryzae]|uniref:CRTAC1 family protein n=1 Tax=Adhaeribacter rhizoryzae TaxID=2607907 RepID=A0A5M6DNX6_9BACT|nr:CRTAC1 family protein [Adhaeribacter rhizoryzae]KAA5549133.1 CRTAC1 family protein [Adhaeribacter rhizoryzae]
MRNIYFWLLLSLIGFTACQPKQNNAYQDAATVKMVELLENTAKKNYIPDNKFANQVRVIYLDSLAKKSTGKQKFNYENQLATELLRVGRSKEAAVLFQKLYNELSNQKNYLNPLEKQLLAKLEANIALAYLRTGEQENCLVNHTSASCIFPIRAAGFHTLPQGSSKAISHYTTILQKHPDALQYRWLLNIAYMTLGQYPNQVPAQWLIPGIDKADFPARPFPEIAASLGLDVAGISGGSIIEDFNNDNYLDLVVSAYGLRDQMRYFRNNGDGTFTDITEKAGLKGMVSGLNMVQADYNNDGFTDILVLRGAWHEEFGNQPNSLLQNKGDGTFRDVTVAAGLLSLHPTQTATWQDFNNDGWLDLFIGNEQYNKFTPIPSELYLSNRNGTFTNITEHAGLEINEYVKGVTSGDFDNDGFSDIYVSTLHGKNHLFRNNGPDKKGLVQFTDVTDQAGLGKPIMSFPTFFWDYNNDGWLDIFVSGYKFSTDPSVGYNIAAEYLGLPSQAENARLYRNNQNGTFTDVSEAAGVNKAFYTMGCNFLDYDNDGFLDMYLATGDPSFESLIPNKLLRNNAGQNFQDVTTAAQVGHLQKGHAIAVGDLDNDGDRDIYAVLGGAFEGDNYQNALFQNPYNSNESNATGNNWISIKPEGKKANRGAIGTRLKFTLDENGKERFIHRDVNSGGSFGAATLKAEVGLGKATVIKALEIRWAGSGTVQVLKNIPVNQFIRIQEGNNQVQKITVKKLNFAPSGKQHHHNHQMGASPVTRQGKEK